MQVDVDFNSETADAYAVTSLPTFIFIKQKNVLGRYEGCGELFGPLHATFLVKLASV